jgi:uncharacterized membrane protein
MFQTHCYDSWLTPAARNTTFFMWSQLVGGLTAPLFLFLAGISFALMTEKLRQREHSAHKIALLTLRRGAEIFAIGLLFRLQQFAFNWRWAPWSDLLRVDILNIVGISMMLMGIVCWVGTTLAKGARSLAATSVRSVSIVLALAMAVAISLASPPLWTTYRPRWLPWPLETYINGVHNLGEPKPYFFPLFPWAGFAFVGLAAGFLLSTSWTKRHGTAVFALSGGLGAGLAALAHWCDHLPLHFYAVYSFWTTSPEYFAIRVGLLLIVLFAAYLWCRWGAAGYGFSPVMQLGRTSLLVYWVHIEFVYDRLSVLPRHANSIREASYGLGFITLFMLVLSLLRSNLAGRGPALYARFRSALRPA